MKKQATSKHTNKKLQLDTTKIRVLTPTDLDTAVGGRNTDDNGVPTRCC